MALHTYQRLFCLMVSSETYRSEVSKEPVNAFYGFELTDIEQQRLIAMASQKGMRVTGAIHRANRLTPLDQTMPFTCLLLGNEIGDVLDRYWKQCPTENLQLPDECARFASFLQIEIEEGRIRNPYIEEVAVFERCCTEFRFLTEEELHKSPLAMVAFRHDPEILLSSLSNRQIPKEVPAGVFYLVIDCRSGKVVFKLLDDEAAASFQAVGCLTFSHLRDFAERKTASHT